MTVLAERVLDRLNTTQGSSKIFFRSLLETERPRPRAVWLPGVRCGELATSCKLAQLGDVIEMREEGRLADRDTIMPRKRVFVKISFIAPRKFAGGRRRIKFVRTERRKPRPHMLRRAQIAIILFGGGLLAFCGAIVYFLQTSHR